MADGSSFFLPPSQISVTLRRGGRVRACAVRMCEASSQESFKQLAEVGF